jgi:pimeloyl-ACP methyl ester carboxylesterase
MPYVTNQGIGIYYEVEGSGPPLVLAHGISGSLEDWREVGWVEALRDRYQLVLVDARGHGRSDKPHEPGAYRHVDRAMDHLEVMDDLSLQKAHFFGFSMGGQVCLAVGIHAPERCLSLVMGGTEFFSRDVRPAGDNLPTPKPFDGLPEGKNPIDQLLAKGGEDWVAFFEANMDVSPSMKQRLVNNDFEAVIAQRTAMHERGLAGRLDPVQMPCLVNVGEDEPAYGSGKLLAELLPNAEFVAYPGFHHFEMLTAVDVVLPDILRFLSKAGDQKVSGD